MDNKTIIKQLEKALDGKDEELRLRVEVLVDMLKDVPEPIVTPMQPWPQIPQPTVTYEGATISDTVSGTVSQSVVDAKKNPPKEIKDTAPKGAGAIISNGEQITYTRPKGT